MDRFSRMLLIQYRKGHNKQFYLYRWISCDVSSNDDGCFDFFKFEAGASLGGDWCEREKKNIYSDLGRGNTGI